MKNAHLRFGHLTYIKVGKKTTTQFKVPLDRFIGEPQVGGRVKAHLISALGGDTQIAALMAAINNQDGFTIEGADRTWFPAMLGANAECYRGSLVVEELKRPLRHLVAVSEELAQTGGGNITDRTILIDGSEQFIWASLSHLHGIPGTEQWARWMSDELRRTKAVENLIGIGCNPVLIKAPKGLLMNYVSRGVREGKLRFPENNGPIEWCGFSLSQLLLPRYV